MLVFITYFGTCSVYTVIVARNIKYVCILYIIYKMFSNKVAKWDFAPNPTNNNRKK